MKATKRQFFSLNLNKAHVSLILLNVLKISPKSKAWCSYKIVLIKKKSVIRVSFSTFVS